MAGDSGVIRIGNSRDHHSTYIAGISGVTMTSGATVVVNSDGQLGVQSSSIRYKGMCGTWAMKLMP